MSTHTLDLNLLQVLDAVLAEGSVARAARRLHVTPSAVSNSLARLRQIVGDPLLTKKGRGIVPTPRALELAPILASHLRTLRLAVQNNAFEPRTTTRTFTLALADANQLAILPHLASLFAAEMPRARLRVISIDSLMSLGGLGGAEVDVVIGADGNGEDYHAEPLFQLPTVLICRLGHSALAKNVSREALTQLRHVAVVQAPGKSLRDITGSAYAEAGIPRNVVITVPSFTSAAVIVAATDFVATVPQTVFAALSPALKLGVLPAPIPPLEVPMKLIWHARTHSDAAAAGFRDLIRRAVSRITALRAQADSVSLRPARRRSRRT